ncbi:hypothetical protein MM300_16090 [Evansella sp. LMS18]|jgi:hypothetical protein|uniref:hypothetical protein n=1 Tax=Evansella sp. LMS18 TaxID=2924033 RepID=UPI0020D195F4|nr:hypothetical protein [Evansella sp. LMS18]UTR09404.1 hypothetical protein MM300_16090 [Evansella sp. LMS18]
MEWMIVSLLGAGCLLILVSLLQKDSAKEVEKQVENVSIQLMQEMYQLRKKVSLLEEEHMLSTPVHKAEDTMDEQSMSRDYVLSLHEEGLSVADIAGMTQYSEEEIENILAND